MDVASSIPEGLGMHISTLCLAPAEHSGIACTELRKPASSQKFPDRKRTDHSYLSNAGVMDALRPFLLLKERRALRQVCKHLRASVDACVTHVAAASPCADLKLTAITEAAKMWPHITSLQFTATIPNSSAEPVSNHFVAALNAQTFNKLRNTSIKLVSGSPDALPSLIDSLSAAALHQLSHLQLSSCAVLGSHDLAPLHRCTQLQRLSLAHCRQLSSLPQLSLLPQLLHMNLAGCTSLQSIAPIAACTSLLSLDLTCCTALPPCLALTPLTSCTQLQLLRLDRCPTLLDLTPLSHLHNLRHLHMARCTALRDLSPLAHCTQLQTLDMSSCRALGSLAPLGHCKQLVSLDASFLWALLDLTALGACSLLERLSLCGCTSLSSLQPLARCLGLKRLDLGLCHPLLDLSPLATLTQLQHLHIGTPSAMQLGALVVLKKLRMPAPDQPAADDAGSGDSDSDSDGDDDGDTFFMTGCRR